MKKNRIRNLVGGISFATAFFVFQACYGTPQDYGLDVLVEGKVVSEQSGESIPGIRVSYDNSGQYQFTDESGNFSMYVGQEQSYTFSFEDVDSVQNGQFQKVDSTFDNQDESVFLDIEMKQE